MCEDSPIKRNTLNKKEIIRKNSEKCIPGNKYESNATHSMIEQEYQFNKRQKQIEKEVYRQTTNANRTLNSKASKKHFQTDESNF